MNPRSQRSREKLWVQWEGRLYGVPADLRKARSSAHGEEAGDLSAPFSCKVLKLFVRDGQTVKKGEPVVVVEAMKMEYAYASPRDGKIRKVHAKEGEILQGGSPFVAWEDGNG